MKSKSFILMIVSLGFGLIAAIGISQVMGNNSNAQPKLEMGPVVVAVEQLDHNTILTEDMVNIENWPLKIIPENALTSIEEIKDQAVTRRMGVGVPFTTDAVVHKLELDIRRIPDGFRVYAMKVTAEETVNGLLRPGDFVDVIGTFRVTDRETDEKKTVSATFLKKIRVFNIDGKMNSNPNEDENGSKSSAIIGVLVRQKQAEQIALVEKEGTLKIIMRGESDENDSPADSLESILGNNDKNAAGDEAGDQPMKKKMSTKGQMHIWNGQELEVNTFNNGPVPKTKQYGTPAPRGDSDDNSGSGSKDNSDDILDHEGDFEEDQYPG